MASVVEKCVGQGSAYAPGRRQQSFCPGRHAFSSLAKAGRQRGPQQVNLRIAATSKPYTEPFYLSPSSLNPEGSRVGNGMEAGEEADGSEALYLLQLVTSKEDRSGLTVPDAAIMVSLIGEQGNALVQRIPVHGGSFQSGSVDLVKLRGANLGRLGALWIAPESGTWKMQRATVVEIPWIHTNLDSINRLGAGSDLPSLLDGVGSHALTGLLHLFGENEELIGDSHVAALEVKPCLVHNFQDAAALKSLLGEVPAMMLGSGARESGMEEYGALKTSLLSISTLLVGLGSVLLAALWSKQGGESFAVGGIGGLLYLFLLQKAVDQIPGPALPASPDAADEGTEDGVKDKRTRIRSPIFNLPGAKMSLPILLSSPLSRLTLVASLTVVLGRVVLGRDEIPPQDLLAGAAGFFTSKIATFLAAMNSGPSPPKEGKS